MQKLTKVFNRLIGADVIRIIAMLMVVALHTILNFTQRTDFFATKLWWLFEPLVALSKTSVLLFFMLSGFLVIRKNRSLKDNWQKTKQRVIVPLVFFSLLNLIYEFSKFHCDRTNILAFVQTQLISLTSFPSSSLWFLVVLTFLYLLNPVWQLIFLPKKNQKLAILLVKLTFLYSVIGTIIKFPGLKSESFFNNFTGWTGYVFFYLYGGLIGNSRINFRCKKINFALVMIGLSLTMLGDYYTLFASTHAVKFIWSGYFTDFLSLPVILTAIGLFNWLITAEFSWAKRIVWGHKLQPVIAWLAGLSFGIYLTHAYVVSALFDLGFDFNRLSMNVYLYNVLNYGLVFGISLMVTCFIKATPKLKKIIGE